MTDIFAILIFAIVVIVVWVVAFYNRLVASREKVREGWSSMDIQLKRRSNVVENLLNTVKGYVKHEKDALEAVTEMRTRTISAAAAGAAERETAEGELSTALIRLFAVAESYPELKADGTFIELQRTLATLEAEIQTARRHYNGCVRRLNTKIASVPGNIVARRFGFELAAYYEVEHAADRTRPEVSFLKNLMTIAHRRRD